MTKRIAICFNNMAWDPVTRVRRLGGGREKGREEEANFAEVTISDTKKITAQLLFDVQVSRTQQGGDGCLLAAKTEICLVEMRELGREIANLLPLSFGGCSFRL